MTDLQEQVQELLDGLVAAGTENGVQAAVYLCGELVADAVAGVADPETGRAVTTDTPFFVASTAKGVTATVVHVLADRGVLGYDTRIAELWPEFGVHGKENATVRHALSHSLGIPAMPADSTFELYRDWDAACRVVAGLEPWWTPGERAGYHPITYGFVLGEVVRRVTGKPISQVLAEEVAGPLGMDRDLYLGVPDSEVGRLARFTEDPAGTAMFASLPDDFPLFRTGPKELMPSAALANRADVLTHDVPGWGVASARGVARMYAALLDEVDGVRLVSPARLREMTTLATSGTDQMTGGEARYALGYTVGTIGTTPVRPSVFGMVGLGGSAGYADTATGLVVAVTKNRFNPVEINAFERVWELASRALT